MVPGCDVGAIQDRGGGNSYSSDSKCTDSECSGSEHGATQRSSAKRFEAKPSEAISGAKGQSFRLPLAADGLAVSGGFSLGSRSGANGGAMVDPFLHHAH